MRGRASVWASAGGGARSRGVALAVALAVAMSGVALAGTGHAQPTRGMDERTARALTERLERQERSEALQERAFAALARRDLDEARAALEEQIVVDPANFVPYYNLACVLSERGELDTAADRLVEAVEWGFSDHWQLQRDPNLANLRRHERFALLVNNWDQIQNAAAAERFEKLKREYGPRYSYQRDEDLRINVASGFSAESTRRATEEIRFLTSWALDTIFKDLREPAMGETDPWVTVVLPTKADFIAWAVTEYGASAALGDMNRIGGAYSHDRKQLVAMDLGSTFRHEFLHVLHHRSNTRMGQGHRVWIQEGLCALVEDYDVVGGVLRPTASWRTNSVKRLERAGGLMTIRELAELPRERFTGSRPLANYAYARAVFLFLSDRGLLGAWYDDFVARWSVDPSGVTSLLAVLRFELEEELDAEFRRWLRALPEVSETPGQGGATLGIEVEPGDGEGPVVTGVGSAARSEGLRVGDVLTSVDGRPTRDLYELARVMGSYQPGRRVTVGYRRGRVFGEVTLTLGRAR